MKQTMELLAVKRARLEEKECTVCFETKPLNKFVKNNRNSSGYKSQCKECWSEYMNQRNAKKQGEDFLYQLLQCSRSSSKNKGNGRVLKNTLTLGHFQELAKLHRVDYKNNTMQCAKSGHIIHMKRSSDFQVRPLFKIHFVFFTRLTHVPVIQ
jgi:hypothetical protein